MEELRELIAELVAEVVKRCKKGDELAVVVSPEALLKKDTAAISRNALVEELQRTVATAKLAKEANIRAD